VELHFIRPTSPQENGRHEHMNRTLKEHTLEPPAADADEQQAGFDTFRRHCNEERPYESLRQRRSAMRPGLAHDAELRLTRTTRAKHSTPMATDFKLCGPCYETNTVVRGLATITRAAECQLKTKMVKLS
jgi:hypothetical protein